MTCAYDILYFYSQIVLRSKVLRHHFYFLPKVIIQVQNDNGVLNRLDLCLKCMELAYQILHGHFEFVELLQVSKNDDEERCFLK